MDYYCVLQAAGGGRVCITELAVWYDIGLDDDINN